jgi:hypothetical protein
MSTSSVLTANDFSSGAKGAWLAAAQSAGSEKRRDGLLNTNKTVL